MEFIHGIRIMPAGMLFYVTMLNYCTPPGPDHSHQTFNVHSKMMTSREMNESHVKFKDIPFSDYYYTPLATSKCNILM